MNITHDMHCWHTPIGSSGVTRGDGRAGYFTQQCCYCGLRMEVPWTTEEEPIKGHGPYVTQSVKKYSYPMEPCPERPIKDRMRMWDTEQ